MLKKKNEEKNMIKSLNDKNIKNAMFFLLAIVASIAVILIPLPDSVKNVGKVSLNGSGQIALGILVFALVLWLTEAIPFHITGLLSMFLLAVLNVDSFKNIVKEGFGNDIITFFIGVLILSSYISRSGLGKRISVFILSLTGNSTRVIILGFIVVGTLLSMWITDMAVAAMLMPLARAILEQEKVTPQKSNFGKALMIASVWGALIGGIATPAGCGPNPIAMGFLREMAGINLNFFDWMIYGLPSALLLIMPSWLILLLFFPPEMKTLSKSRKELRAEFKSYPKMDREETVTVVIFILTVVAWLITPWLEGMLKISIPISMPVLFTACLFFIPGTSKIKWSVIERDISWSGILLVVSGLSLGMMLYKSGAAEWISVMLLGGIGDLSLFMKILVVVFITSVLKIAFSSNTVTATVLIPIVIALAKNLGIPPLTIALPASITSSLAFILVTSSPTNLIPYSAGYFTIKDFAKSGMVLTIVSTIIVTLVIYTMGSIVGLY